jgi:hypothetical protein
MFLGLIANGSVASILAPPVVRARKRNEDHQNTPASLSGAASSRPAAAV